jgi:hypothetical protein
MSITTVDRLQLSLRWLWVGPVGALACAIVLAVYGFASDRPALVVMASTLAAVAGGVWASTHVSVRRRLARATEQAEAAGPQ